MRVQLYVYFSPKDTYFSTVIHDLKFVESWNAEPQIWRSNYKVIQGFLIAQRASVPNLYVFQGSVYRLWVIMIYQCMFIRL